MRIFQFIWWIREDNIEEFALFFEPFQRICGIGYHYSGTVRETRSSQVSPYDLGYVWPLFHKHHVSGTAAQCFDTYRAAPRVKIEEVSVRYAAPDDVE